MIRLGPDPLKRADFEDESGICLHAACCQAALQVATDVGFSPHNVDQQFESLDADIVGRDTKFSLTVIRSLLKISLA